MATSSARPSLGGGVALLGRVLVVDDEPELRRVLRRSLSRGGYEVMEAANGSAALQLTRQERFDVVICDVRMPVMNGLELLARLVEEEPHLPVVLISGSTECNRPSAIDRGAFEFLAKPISLTHLQAVTSSAMAEGAELQRLERESHERLLSAAALDWDGTGH